MKKIIAAAVMISFVQSLVPLDLFAATEDAESLMFQDVPVIITATKTEQAVTEAPAAAAVITGEQLKRLGAVTIADALKLIPGVYVSVSERHLLRVHIRGVGNTVSSYNDKILLMIDGTPQRELVFAHAFIDEYLPVDNIKQIEVIKGPGSALYGTNAFAGVINVITKDAEDVDGIELMGGAGTAQTKMGSILTGHKIKDAKVLIFARTFQTKGDGGQFASRSQRNALQEDPVRADSYQLKASYKGLSMDAKYFEFYHLFSTNWDIPETAWDRNQFNYKHAMLDLKYERPITEWLSGMAKVWWRDANDYNYWQRTSGFSITADVYPFKLANLYGAQTEFKVKLPFNNHIVTGAQLDIEKVTKVVDIEITRATGRMVEPSAFAIRPITHQNYALYAEDIWKPLPWMDITAGVRHDVNEVFGNFTSPRGGIVFRPTDKAGVKLLYGEAFRAPSNREKYVIASGFTEGNINLSPERIRTGEVEVNYQFAKRLRGQVSYYQNRIKDTLTSVLDGTRTVWINDVGQSVIEGIESQVEYSVGKARMWANYSWIDGRDKNGDVLYNLPNHLANAGVDYSVTERLTVNPTASFVGDRFRRADDRNSSARDNRYPTGFRRPDIEQYFIVNLPFTYKFRGAEITVAVHNLFDQQYFDHAESVPNRDIERPGRNILAKASYKF